jgi:hypothetical protein
MGPRQDTGRCARQLRSRWQARLGLQAREAEERRQRRRRLAARAGECGRGAAATRARERIRARATAAACHGGASGDGGASRRRRREQATARLLLGHARKRGGRQGVRARSEGEALLDDIRTGLLTWSEARRPPLVVGRRTPRGGLHLRQGGTGSWRRGRLGPASGVGRETTRAAQFKTSFFL